MEIGNFNLPDLNGFGVLTGAYGEPCDMLEPEEPKRRGRRRKAKRR